MWGDRNSNPHPDYIKSERGRTRINMIEEAFEQFKGMIKRLFCDHKEEDIVQAIRMPYGYHKCCFKCKKCGRER